MVHQVLRVHMSLAFRLSLCTIISDCVSMAHFCCSVPFLEQHWLLIRPYLLPNDAPDSLRIKDYSDPEQDRFFVWAATISDIALLSEASKFQWWPQRHVALGNRQRILKNWRGLFALRSPLNMLIYGWQPWKPPCRNISSELSWVSDQTSMALR